MRAWKRVFILLATGAFISGCASQSSLLYERHSKTSIATPSANEIAKGPAFLSALTPASVTVDHLGLEITARYFSPEQLEMFFTQQEPFKSRWGVNPFSPEIMVFFFKVCNRSGGKVRIAPEEAVLLDNLGRQYEYLTPDYLADLSSSHNKTYTMAKETSDSAPGIYGAPLRMFSSLAGIPVRKRFALLKQIMLNGGIIHEDVTYDGFLAFKRPPGKVEKLNLIIPDVKIKIAPDGETKNISDFGFSFACPEK